MLLALLFALSQPPCGALCNDDAFTLYSQLLDRGKWGRSLFEKAAFLVVDDAGVHAVPWREGSRHSASFEGPVPENCLGIMHTHPLGDSVEPSYGDRLDAQRLKLPVVVVTPQAVTVAWADGTVSYLANGAGWNVRRRPAQR